MTHIFFGMAFWPYVLLPGYIQALGADPLQIGMMMGAASLSGVLIRPWIGHLLDRNGRRRYLIIGELVFFATHLFYLGSSSFGWALLVIRLVHGLAIGILVVTFFTLAADLSPRVGGIALFGISGQLSGTLGVPIAEKAVSLGGYPALFLFCASMSGISLLLCLCIRDTKQRKSETDFKLFFQIAARAALRVPLLATFAFSLGTTSFIVFLKPYLLMTGVGRVTHFFLAYTLSAMAIRLIGGDWPDRYGQKWTLYPALLSLAIGILLLTRTPSLSGLIVSGILCGIGHGFAFPILSITVIERGGAVHRGALMALYTLTFDLGGFIGSPLFGWVVREQGYTTLYVVAALIVTFSVTVLAGFDKISIKDRRRLT